jgi:hypothetical protein
MSDRGDAALAEYRQALAIAATLVVRSPTQLDLQLDVAGAYEAIGVTLVDLGRLDEAIAVLQLDHDISARLAARDPANAVWRGSVSASAGMIAEVRAMPRRR